MTDPFPITPPSAEERARVASDAALLSAAADRLERQIADGRVDPLFIELVAWLRDAAREAVEIGPNRFAVALARKIMGEGRLAAEPERKCPGPSACYAAGSGHSHRHVLRGDQEWVVPMDEEAGER